MQTLIKPTRRSVNSVASGYAVASGYTAALQQQARQHAAPQPKAVACALLTATPALDRHTYERLIADATELYAQGNRTIHIDLQQTKHIAQSGLFALYCVHLIFQGERLPDPEAGMGALRYVTERVQLDGDQPVCLINVPEHLAALIARAGFAVSVVSSDTTAMS